MNAAFVVRSRRLLSTLVLTAMLALATIYAPVALEELAGIDVAPALYACGPQTGGGCG